MLEIFFTIVIVAAMLVCVALIAMVHRKEESITGDVARDLMRIDKEEVNIALFTSEEDSIATKTEPFVPECASVPLNFTSEVGPRNTQVAFEEGLMNISKGCTQTTHRLSQDDCKKLSEVLRNWSEEDLG